MGAEIKEAYFVPSKGEIIAIIEAEEETLGAILFAINASHIEEEARSNHDP